MSPSLLGPQVGDLGSLQYISTHVFSPLQLPDRDDHSIPNDRSLSRAVASVARLYSNHIDQAKVPQWYSIPQMLDNIHAAVQYESLDHSRTVSQLGSMNVAGKLSSLHGTLRLTTCRCPRVSHPGPKCGDPVQKARRCHHLRVVRGIPEG